MDERERELLDAMVNRVLRYPDEVKDIDAQRAVQRLMAARADAPYLLLQRALVLEVALARAHAELDRLRGAAAVAANDPGPPSDPSAVAADAAARIAAALPSRGFLRDAAVISAGVLGGSLLVAAAGALLDDDPPDAGADFDPGELI